MSIENSRSSSIDGQWIRDNETKEFEYGYSKSEDAKTAYQKIVERLALNKIKNELLFNGMLDAQLRSFSRDGITISREQLISDINKEVARQQVDFDLDSDMALDVQQPQVQSEIDRLKSNLGSSIDASPTKSQQPISQSTTIPREPAIESVGVTSAPESIVQPAHTEQEKQGLESHNQQVQQEQQNKDTLINGIIGRMADAGEFSHIPLEDVSQRVDTMNMVKKRLQEKSIDELEIILNSYANQEDKTESTGMHK